MRQAGMPECGTPSGNPAEFDLAPEMTRISPLAPGSMPEAALTIGCCIALLLLTTWLHYEALRAIRLVHPRGATTSRARTMLVLLGISTAHVTEVFLYAGAYYLLARYAHVGTLGGLVSPSLNASLYFSLETYSSLGYGDIVPSGALRAMAGVEALNGLLLIGWSACYAHGALDVFPDRADRSVQRLHRRNEDVPGAALGDDQLRPGRIDLDLAAQPDDLDVDRSLVDLGVVKP
jgi:hypothetical protein